MERGDNIIVLLGFFHYIDESERNRGFLAYYDKIIYKSTGWLSYGPDLFVLDPIKIRKFYPIHSTFKLYPHKCKNIIFLHLYKY